jgi:molybdenum cofactor cytidylyltransferase
MADRLLIAVLAAGASRRLGQPKQLVSIDGEPLLRRQCRVALEAELGHVVAILGYEADRCAQALAGLPVTIHVNEQWEEGLASSIRSAAEMAALAVSPGLLLLHGDQHRVTAQDLLRLNGAWTANRSRACRARHQSYAGPPVILPASMFAAMSALRGDQGARALLAQRSSGELPEVEMPNAVYDLDLPVQLPDLNRSR